MPALADLLRFGHFDVRQTCHHAALHVRAPGCLQMCKRMIGAVVSGAKV